MFYRKVQVISDIFALALWLFVEFFIRREIYTIGLAPGDCLLNLNQFLNNKIEY